MKLAVVDYYNSPEFVYWSDLKRFEDALTERGVSVRRARTIDEFEKEYGSLNGFDGFLFHPGNIEQQRRLRTITQEYPELRFAIASHDIDSSFNDGRGLAIFDYKDVDGIFEYFFSNGNGLPGK